MLCVVLQELPQGQQPGEMLDVHEDVVNILIVAGAARLATEDDVKGQAEPRSRRRYQRRDLVAEE